MTPDQLYNVLDVETAARDAVRAAFVDEAGVSVYAGPLPPKAGVPYVLLTVRSPIGAGPMMAGDQQVSLTLSATCTGRDHPQASGIGARVRQVILGRARDGSFATDLPLEEGHQVLGRFGNSDGAPDNVGGVQQWTETFRIVIGAA